MFEGKSGPKEGQKRNNNARVRIPAALRMLSLFGLVPNFAADKARCAR